MRRSVAIGEPIDQRVFRQRLLCPFQLVLTVGLVRPASADEGWADALLQATPTP